MHGIIKPGNPYIGTIRRRDVDPAQLSAVRRYGSWRRFHYGPRQEQEPLLGRLGRYHGCVLVAGCQRSGTTMLCRIISGSPAFRRFQLTHDDELDAALILAGRVDVPLQHRYCFQTTYLNERYGEYGRLAADQRLLWVLRNPYSVVYSMVYNWKRFALNELYDASPAAIRSRHRPRLGQRLLRFRPPAVERASVAYAAKTSQVLEISKMLSPAQLMVLDYDLVVERPEAWLPKIFAFVDAPYDDAYAGQVSPASVKKAESLTAAERETVASLAGPAYAKCLALLAAKP